MLKLTLTVISALIVVAAAFGGVAQYTNSAFGFVTVTPYEADVNKNGTVNAIDLMQVAQKFGMPVPTATATSSTVRLLTDTGVGAGQVVFTPYVPTVGCDGAMTLFAQRSASAYFDNWITVGYSLDGTTPAGESTSNVIGQAGSEGWAQQNVPSAYLDVTGSNAAPYVRFGIDNGNATQTITVDLYCE